MSDPRVVFQTEQDSSDQGSSLIENSPLREATPDSIEELLARVNEDLVAGAPQRITDNDPRLKALIEIYRKQAIQWTIDEANKPRKGEPRTKKERETSTAMALDLDI